jgi:quinol monooxygenase YgiN
MAKEVVVLAHFRAKENLEEEALKAASKLIGPTRVESGCIEYNLHQSSEVPQNFVFYERWRSKADLDEHLKMSYIEEFMEESGPLLEEPVRVTLWNKAGE